MDKEKRFYPDYLFEVLLVVFLVFALTLILAMVFPKELGRRINLAAPFQPTPEWYFLWLFDLLRYFPGRSAFIAAVVIPVLSVTTLAMIPSLDRGPKGGQTGRRRATVAFCLLFGVFFLFTLISALSP